MEEKAKWKRLPQGQAAMIKISNGHRALKDINSRRGRGKWYLPCFQSPFLDIRPFLRRSTKKALSFLTELLLWRREGDSNPRDGIRRQHDFQSCTLNRSDTSPCCLFLALRPAPCCFHQWLTDLCSIPTDASYVKHFFENFLRNILVTDSEDSKGAKGGEARRIKNRSAAYLESG